MSKTQKKVLNSGFVELVDKMGDDYSVLRAARVSTGSDIVKGEKKDRGLIRYLYRNEHLTPFEFVSLQFHVKAPIFVARQWFRHRTSSYNEASARYKEFEWDTFTPESWRIQDTENKQSSNGEIDHQSLTTQMVEGIYSRSKDAYESLLEHNVAREQARTVMPVGQYTEFFVSFNLRNLFHFIDLRADEHAQYEIRVYAQAMLEIISGMDDLKWSVEVFNDTRGLKQEFFRAMNKAFKEKTIKELGDHLRSFGE